MSWNESASGVVGASLHKRVKWEERRGKICFSRFGAKIRVFQYRVFRLELSGRGCKV